MCVRPVFLCGQNLFSASWDGEICSIFSELDLICGAMDRHGRGFTHIADGQSLATLGGAARWLGFFHLEQGVMDDVPVAERFFPHSAPSADCADTDGCNGAPFGRCRALDWNFQSKQGRKLYLPDLNHGTGHALKDESPAAFAALERSAKPLCKPHMRYKAEQYQYVERLRRTVSRPRRGFANERNYGYLWQR